MMAPDLAPIGADFRGQGVLFGPPSRQGGDGCGQVGLADVR